MEFCKLILTFESVDEFLWCDHLNETFSTLLFVFAHFRNEFLTWATSGSERVKSFSPLRFFRFFFFFTHFLFLSWTALASHVQTFFWFVTQSSIGTRDEPLKKF